MRNYKPIAIRCAAVVGLLTGWAVGVEGSLINGDFNSLGLPPGQSAQALPVNSSFLTGWLTVPGIDGTYSGTVEYFHDRSQDPGGYSVELGFYDGASGLQQTFNTTASQSYVVTFWLATDPFNGTAPGRLRVSAGGTSADFTAPLPTGSSTAMGWQEETFAFTSDGSGSTTLLFQNLPGPHGAIPAIDTISVSAVPEPSTLTLVGTAALVALGYWWRSVRPTD
jgi:hypothetical protein